MAISTYRIQPVIFTGGKGSHGSDEFGFPNLPKDPERVPVQVDSAPFSLTLPQNGTIIATCWAPYDNIQELAGFHTIDVFPSEVAGQIIIYARGVSGSATRIRLMITLFVQT